MLRKKMMLLTVIVAVVLGAAATGLAASPSESDPAKGTLGKGELGKNKNFSGLVGIGGDVRFAWSAPVAGLPRSCSYPALEVHTTTGPM